MKIRNVLQSSRWIFSILIVMVSSAAVSPVEASPADPYTLDEVNISRRVMATLIPPDNLSEQEKSDLLSSREYIARSILLLTYETLSVERLRSILRWSNPIDPSFAPGVSPAAGNGQRPPYIFGRTQNWRLHPNGSVTIDVVWTPFLKTTSNHFVEVQWYRRIGEAWYLYKQDRQQVPGCFRWPKCLGSDA